MRIERTFLVTTSEDVDICAENFKHCATIQEVYDELNYYIENLCEHPRHEDLLESEEIQMRFYDYDENTFFDKWQKLKNLPPEL